MLKFYTVGTDEIDDNELAVSEIISALEERGELLKNSVGFLSCYDEYLENGIIELLSNKLSFPILGGSSIYCSTNDISGEMILSLSVLTSDENEFAIYNPTKEELASTQSIAKGILDISKEKDNLPSFSILLMSPEYMIRSDELNKAISDATKGAPLYGAVPFELNMNEANPALENGVINSSIAILLVFGDIDIAFISAAFPDSAITDKKGIVSDSEGNLLKSINDAPPEKFFTQMGIDFEASKETIGLFPLVLNHGTDKVSLVRSIMQITEEGHFLCAGDIPVGSSISIAKIDKECIEESANQIVESILNIGPVEGVLFTSCYGRANVLGIDVSLEGDIINKWLGDKIPYMYSYSSGELCPLINKENEIVNTFQNFSMSACVIKKQN